MNPAEQCSGSSLTERLRRENTDQFLTLVRMHLSFVVDINTDEVAKLWNALPSASFPPAYNLGSFKHKVQEGAPNLLTVFAIAIVNIRMPMGAVDTSAVDSSTDKPKQFRWGFSKKSKNIPNPATPSANIKCTAENSITDEGISKVYELIDFLVKDENVKQEGIFRRTGSLSRQQELKQLLMSGSSLGLLEGRFSVHDCASVLKGFLAELPQPLLMDQYYQTYCTLAAQYPPNVEASKSRLLTALQLLLLLLSPLHRTLLQQLLTLLRVAASHEASNRMSPDTLATMFTPHLLCPRKLGPEALHSDAVALAPLVSFMIRQAEWLFQVPAQLATDVAAYFTMRERRRVMSPDVDLDESISDRTAANTVYTFVDRHRTTVENQANPTDTALAQLYAHIQALPDSQHKRKLIKQFNRQNGYGTPIQVQRTGKAAGSKSLGESIKRHIFNKGLLNKTPKKSSSGSIPSVAEKRSPFSKEKLRFSGEDSGKTLEVSHKNIILKNLAHKMASAESLDNVEDYDSDASDDSTQSEGSLLDRAHKMSPKFVSEPNLSILDSKINDETPKNTRKRTRLFRSKVISASNLNKKYAPKKGNNARSTPTSCVSCVEEQDTATDSDTSVAHVRRDHKDLAASPSVSSITPVLSRHDSMKQVKYRIFSTNIDSSGDGSEVQLLSKLNYLTSTPGIVVCDIEEPTTPYFSNFRRASMSPITKSTQKLSKAMQESIMTPRSRKPLIIMSEQRDTSLIETKKPDVSDSRGTIYGSVSPKNDSDFVSSDESEHRTYSSSERDLKTSNLSAGCENVQTSYNKNSIKVSATDVSPHIDSVSVVPNVNISNEMSSFYLEEYKSRSLTDPFREYLLSRSVLTAAPVDLSLVNRSEDSVAGETISDSLMFCLDGNVPSDLTSSINSLAVDKVMSNEKEGDVPRSPLKNLKNYINITKLMESPRKRCAAVNDIDSEETGAGTYKKIPRIPEPVREKENLTERESNISLWETDL